MVKLIGPKKVRTAVFISGTGSNLKSLIKFSLKKVSPIEINLIVSNNVKAKGLELAKLYKIKKIGVNIVIKTKIEIMFQLFILNRSSFLRYLKKRCKILISNLFPTSNIKYFYSF